MSRASGQMPFTQIPTDYVRVKVDGYAESVYIRAEWLESLPSGPVEIKLFNPRVCADHRWLTVTQAATELLDDDDGLEPSTARSYVVRAADAGKFTAEGNGLDRRIEPLSFARWRCDRRKRRVESDDVEDIELRKAAMLEKKRRELED